MVDSLLNDIEFGENWNLTPGMNFLMQGFFWPVEWTEHYPSNFTKIKKTISMPRYEIIKQLGPWQGEPNIACCLTIGLAQKYKSFPTERFGRAISWRFRNLLFAPSGIWQTDLNRDIFTWSQSWAQKKSASWVEILFPPTHILRFYADKGLPNSS